MGLQRQQTLQANRVRDRLIRKLAAHPNVNVDIHPVDPPDLGLSPQQFAQRLPNPAADIVQGGTSGERQIARRTQREQLAPQTKGVEGAAYAMRTGVGLNDQNAERLARILLAQKFIGGDLIQGGTKQDDRALRDRLKYIRAAKGI